MTYKVINKCSRQEKNRSEWDTSLITVHNIANYLTFWDKNELDNIEEHISQFSTAIRSCFEILLQYYWLLVNALTGKDIKNYAFKEWQISVVGALCVRLIEGCEE